MSIREWFMREPKRMKFDEAVDTGLDDGGKLELEFVRGVIPDADTLNIGCWTGSFEERATGLAGSMTAVDIEPKALEVARKRVPEAEFIEASVFDLPFEERSFDLVTLWEVIEHIPVGTEASALSEIARVLRPGGYLALSTPNASLFSRLGDPAHFLAGHRHYSAARISSELARAGFSIERIDVLGGWCSVLGVLVFYAFKWLFHRRPPEWKWLAGARAADEAKPGFNTLYVLARRGKPDSTTTI